MLHVRIKKPTKISGFIGQGQKIIDTNNSINKILIETCIQYHDLYDNETGMSIFEANLFSGFEVSKADMDNLLISKNTSSELKLIEILKDNKVAFYMQKLNSKNVCFNWTMTRSYLVSF